MFCSTAKILLAACLVPMSVVSQAQAVMAHRLLGLSWMEGHILPTRLHRPAEGL